MASCCPATPRFVAAQLHAASGVLGRVGSSGRVKRRRGFAVPLRGESGVGRPNSLLEGCILRRQVTTTAPSCDLQFGRQALFVFIQFDHQRSREAVPGFVEVLLSLFVLTELEMSHSHVVVRKVIRVEDALNVFVGA